MTSKPKGDAVNSAQQWSETRRKLRAREQAMRGLLTDGDMRSWQRVTFVGTGPERYAVMRGRDIVAELDWGAMRAQLAPATLQLITTLCDVLKEQAQAARFAMPLARVDPGKGKDHWAKNARKSPKRDAIEAVIAYLREKELTPSVPDIRRRVRGKPHCLEVSEQLVRNVLDQKISDK